MEGSRAIIAHSYWTVCSVIGSPSHNSTVSFNFLHKICRFIWDDADSGWNNFGCELWQFQWAAIKSKRPVFNPVAVCEVFLSKIHDFEDKGWYPNKPFNYARSVALPLLEYHTLPCTLWCSSCELNVQCSILGLCLTCLAKVVGTLCFNRCAVNNRLWKTNTAKEFTCYKHSDCMIVSFCYVADQAKKAVARARCFQKLMLKLSNLCTKYSLPVAWRNKTIKWLSSLP